MSPSTAFTQMIHSISSILLIPTIIVLLLFVAFTVATLGGLLAETLMERRSKKVEDADLIDAFQGKGAPQLMEEIAQSQLLQRQKQALGELVQHGDLSIGSLQALARKLLSREELYYEKKTAWTDLVTRLGPMFGLMATLIPLGPGLLALGQGDTKTLAESLLTAFDATVTGLATAGVCFAVSKIRKRWYEGYLSSTEALMESLLEVLTDARRIEK